MLALEEEDHQTITEPRTMRSLSTDREERNSSALFLVSPGSLHSPAGPSVGGLRMAQEFTHQSVLLEEVVADFDPVPSGLIVDATVGAGGHAWAILNRRPDVMVIGIDRDAAAREAATERLAPFVGRFSLVASRFSDIAAAVEQGREQLSSSAPVVGILADLGVSSPQLDHGYRGFSFNADAPLDMRMDPDHDATAAQLLESISLNELTQLLRDNGEAKYARRLATTMLAGKPQTTSELVDLVDGAIPKGDRRRGHVASRVFQALRIAVNQELDELAALLDVSLSILVPQGRLEVISYHSGEDAMVKHTMREWELGGCTCPATLPCVCGATPKGHCVSRRAVVASESEIERNPRSRSARLRTFEVAS